MIEDYLAKKVVQDIRDGTRLDDELCFQLNQFPVIDALRKCTEPGDVDALLLMAKPLVSKPATLALSMLRAYASDKRIQSFLNNAWDESTSYRARFVLLWRLLDDTALESGKRNDIFRFVMENIDQFLSDVPAFFGGKAKVVDGCTARLADTATPPLKAWIYLACSAAGDDDERVLALLRRHLNSNDDLVNRCAEKMSERVSSRLSATAKAQAL